MPLSIYIHIPFCASKCPYCDFHSYAVLNSAELDGYANALCREILSWSQKLKDKTVKTVYIGGGTPSVFGAERLIKVLAAIQKNFELPQKYSSAQRNKEKSAKNDDTKIEITVEINPESASFELFSCLAESGVNRISMGVQSLVKAEAEALGRLCALSGEELKNIIKTAQKAGIQNVSVDLMLGIPMQTANTAVYSARQAAKSGATHISAYMLKCEPNTPFGKKTPRLPCDDETADIYLACCGELESHGFKQYEISNFAKTGCKSNHNLAYWQLSDYIGIGASAHSFINGKRFFYPRDTANFMNGAKPVQDGSGGGADEFIMLGLRLTKGLSLKTLEQKFGISAPAILNALKLPLNCGLAVCENGRLQLTRQGFLMSNSVISLALEALK
jgi:oxygen-independent coproporphyrinogen-3 oxidase